MKNISTMVQSYQQTQKVAQKRKQAHTSGKMSISVDRNTAMLVNELFKQLRVIFPAWSVSLKNQDMLNESKKTWIKAFAENGITTIEQLERGFKKARASTNPFLPSVGMFISWCQPTAQDLGLMSFEQARKEIIDRNNTHQAVIAMINEMGGTSTVRSLNAVELDKRLKKAYDAISSRMLSGETFVRITAELPTHRTYSAEKYSEMGKRGIKLAKKKLAGE